ncbi:putative Alkaline-phosphatase-like protein [Seiridium cardinale]|uniref:Alkaline-phosphatase-like protein n=1 Tax=Seiridium cardinale TaxID=138064 RepID=A0ABR2Y4X6_9PEZI
MPEAVLEHYVRDAFAAARKDNERLFLGHLTSTSHHPFKIPDAYSDGAPSKTKRFKKRDLRARLQRASASKAQRYATKEDLEDLSKYLNSISYVDQWVCRIMNTLSEQGVAHETHLVIVGDHGFAIAEDGSITPYEKPSIGNFRVPLILSHPKLPNIDIEDAVISSQILPTILDLLVETKSLSTAEERAVHDLLHNYEGQSLLRPLTSFTHWQTRLAVHSD